MWFDTCAHQLCHRLGKHSEQQLGLAVEAAHQLLQMLQFELVFGAIDLEEQLQCTGAQQTGAIGMKTWRNSCNRRSTNRCNRDTEMEKQLQTGMKRWRNRQEIET